MKGFRSAAAVIVLVFMAALLSGCLYPKDQMGQFQKPPKDAILTVQTVIDQFQKDTGLLPIQNSEADTPVYEKFKVDFDKLQRMNYVSTIPESAYEKGGSYYYLVINEEKDPTVKLMNLVVYQKMNDLEASVKAYSDTHNGKLPAGKEMYPSFTAIDYDALDVKEPELRSVFTGSLLTAMMDPTGKVYLDYGPDIMQQKSKLPSGNELDPNADLRSLLVDASDFVPVKSPAYRLVNGDPQAVLK
ncbi:hypothetical protein [Paenibacillus sacheonensis]|uniref:Lipoprotein n=1 Tax=Paenibacillus sacheonensis TaxID=742054 RepID=A0A7X4YMI1_9BACL|nr:hypothetical protein [Paenibacillus sacheonensis]MBM7564480.1 hypothetical protein [Paenibacillus sacheonensis]NBC69040.1 hypothetical protein [Paenibacillus sacheonensis]